MSELPVNSDLKFLAWFNGRMYESVIPVDPYGGKNHMYFKFNSDEFNLPLIELGFMFANSNAKILRFSGKLDKLSNPVFESQIVRIVFKDNRKPEFGIIRFGDCEFYVEYGGIRHAISELSEFEIVGNEFENLELLSSINK